VAVAEEAVELNRQLVAANPAAFLPDLAGSLHNLVIRLAEAGRGEEALAAAEAIEVRRGMAKANPAYLPELARSLQYLGMRLADVGRWGEGLAARLGS
jgi:hypothetical protein